MAAVGVKEEVIDNNFSVHHQLVNKRTTPQRRSNQGLMEAPLTTSPSSQNELSHPQGNQLHHTQFMQTFGDISPHHSTQQDNYSLNSMPSGPTMENDRHHQVSQLPLALSGDTIECPKASTPPQTGNSHIINPSEGGSSNPSMKRTHGLSKTSTNDPLSHRIIEKRRRDRMNNCLADLSRLIPTYYLKKGRGRIEKTEIIEMAIKYMKHLQAHACNQIETCEITTKQEKAGREMEHFQLGYQEAMSETLQFLRDSEGLFSGDSLCVRILNHLTKHCEKIVKNEGYSNLKLNGSISSASSSSGYHANGSSNGSSSDGNGSSSNLGSDCKDVILTEESAYRSDDAPYSDEREMSYAPSSSDSHDALVQCVSGSYLQSGPGSNASSSGDDNGNRLYKFKSNMKHRFSADSEHSQPKKKRRDSESSSGYADGEKDGSRRSFCAPSRQSPYAHYAPSHDDRVTPNSHTEKANYPPTQLGGAKNGEERPTVPVFALSSSGAFYVPLSLDQTLLAPFLATQAEGNSSPILHPVSIYVNFRTPVAPLPFHPHPSPLPPTQDALVPRMDPYDAYGERSLKEERRRYPNYAHTHAVNHAPSTLHRGDIRNLRNAGGVMPELQTLPQEGIPQLPHDQRGIGGKHGMREYQSKFPNRGQLPWSYHVTTSYKE